ncbi:MAG: 23S rRNA (uracil(1939)-C(5))-methyltransferase RlmD [Planctomycetes bacterium]|nr:23S rRNA (uracil(1939)-C(5))-methyltransferase RlmD [Planctomycetota bacterium]
MKRVSSTVPVQVGEIVEATCTALGDGPDGLVRVGGYVLFVPGVLPDERVRVEVLSAGRKHGRGRLVEIVEPSPARVAARCPHFLDCGGCSLQHLAVPAQLLRKAERVRAALAHQLARDDVPVEPCVGPDDRWGQRNKVALHLAPGPDGTIIAGHVAPRSARVVPITECAVVDPEAFRLAREAVDAIRSRGLTAWDPDSDAGIVRAVVVRAARATGRGHVILVVRNAPRARLLAVANALLAAGAHGVSVSVNDGPFSRLLGPEVTRIAGERDLDEEVLGVRFRVSAGAFFQTSHWGAEAIARTVAELLDPPGDAVVHDLFAGGGLIGLTLASRVGRVLMVEENPQAIADAEATVQRHGMRNVAVRDLPVERALTFLARGQQPPFGVVLDPPRAGCRPSVLLRITEDVAPRRIVYVACDPDSLARDAELLERRGYRLVTVRPLDVFPHTHHVEAVALFEARAKLDPKRRRLYRRALRNTAGSTAPQPEADRPPD